MAIRLWWWHKRHSIGTLNDRFLGRIPNLTSQCCSSSKSQLYEYQQSYRSRDKLLALELWATKRMVDELM